MKFCTHQKTCKKTFKYGPHACVVEHVQEKDREKERNKNRKKENDVKKKQQLTEIRNTVV